MTFNLGLLVGSLFTNAVWLGLGLLRRRAAAGLVDHRSGT